MFSFIKIGLNAIKNNPFGVCFFISMVGFLSLSFFGLEFKLARIGCSLCVILYALLVLKNVPISIKSDPIIKIFLLYSICCIPSIIFATNQLACGFKLLELFVMYILIILCASNFQLIKGNTFTFIICYGVLQTIISILGYFFDPNAMAADENLLAYRVYVTMLKCNYPPIHSNSLGIFGAVTVYTAFVLWKEKNRYSLNSFKKLLILGLAGVGLSVMYLCSSRTCMISGMIGFLFLYWSSTSAGQKSRSIIIMLMVSMIFASQISEKVTAFMMKSQAEEMLSGSSDQKYNLMLSGRLDIWQIIYEKPEKLILGQGFGVASHEDDSFKDSNAHNAMLELLLNGGVIALLFWLRFWYLIYKRYRYLSKYKDFLPLPWIYYNFAMSIIIMMFVRGFGNVSFIYFTPLDFFVIAVAGLMVYSNYHILVVKAGLANNT